MASPNIQFDTIPAGIRKPGKYFEFNARSAVKTLPGNPQSLVIFAQQTTIGNNNPVRIFDVDTAGRLFGYGSQAHLMVLSAITANSYLDLTVVPLNDPEAGIAASATITLAGTAQENGVISVSIAGQYVAIPVKKDTLAATCAIQLAQAINAVPAVPVVASVTEAGVITLTAKNKGTCGNTAQITVQGSVPGIQCTHTSMAGGLGEPNLTEALAKVFSGMYTIYCLGTQQAELLLALKEHLDALGHPLEQRGGIGVYAYTGDLDAALEIAQTVNSPRITGAVFPGTVSLPYEVAAAYAAVLASEEDPARPLNTLVLKAIAPAEIEQRLSRTQQEVALNNGVTPLEVSSGDVVTIVRAVSTYTRNLEGSLDPSFLDITTIRTLDYVRKAIRERMILRFPREKLSTRTLPKVRSEILDVLRRMESLEVLEQVDVYAEGVIVERDSQDPNRLNARIPADVVNGLHVIAGQIDLLL